MVHASIARKAGIGAVAATLLLAGLFAAAAFARGGGITEPQVIELVTVGCATNDGDPATDCRVFELRDTDGHRSGTIFRFRVPVLDVDGNAVGRVYLHCDGAKGTGQTCTSVLSLKPGPHTERGRWRCASARRIVFGCGSKCTEDGYCKMRSVTGLPSSGTRVSRP